MQNSKLLKISWILFTIGLAVGMILTLVDIIKPQSSFLQEEVEVYTGQSWSILVEQQPKHAAMYELLSRECLCYYFVLCFHALVIVLTCYRKGQMWAWILLLLGSTSTGGVMTIFGFMYLGASGAWPGIVCLCFGLIVLLLPAKEMLRAKEKQTV